MVWPDGAVRTYVGGSQAEIAALAVERYGRPLRLLAISTPESIYADLRGEPHPPPLRAELAAIFLETPEPFASKRDSRVRAHLKAAQGKIRG
jgi:hypothetical protein